MADSRMIMKRIFVLSLACLPLVVAVCAVAAAAPASAMLRLSRAGPVAPSISSRHDLDTDGDGGGMSASSALCLHKASTEAYDGVVPLKDGSGRLLCWKRDGQVWLTTGSVLRVGGNGKPLIDLRTRVSQDSARGRGLAGVAVDSSSRLFVSYYTTTDGPDGGGALLVVDQLAAPWSDHEVEPTATTTRVLSMALPDQSEPPSSSGFPLDYYGGQIMFRPTTTDQNLYLVTGPAQTDGQLQSKILRLPVPSGGNGTVTAQRFAYASISGIPRGCAFDANRAQDLYCAIVEGEQEQVYVVSDPDAPSYSATPPSPTLLVAHQRPTQGTPPSLVGGLLYRGDADATLAGSYIYMDGSQFWVNEASHAGNHSTTRNLRVTCSASATATCSGGGDDFAGSGVTSFGEDEGHNALLLATDGVYQVVAPSLCHDAKTPMSTMKLLEWVLGPIFGLLTALAGVYGVYKKCNCCNKDEFHVNAPNGNVNFFNRNNDIEQGRMGVNN